MGWPKIKSHILNKAKDWLTPYGYAGVKGGNAGTVLAPSPCWFDCLACRDDASLLATEGVTWGLQGVLCSRRMRPKKQKAIVVELISRPLGGISPVHCGPSAQAHPHYLPITDSCSIVPPICSAPSCSHAARPNTVHQAHRLCTHTLQSEDKLTYYSAISFLRFGKAVLLMGLNISWN